MISEEVGNARDYYKSILEQLHGQIAALCALAGAPADAMPDAWTLRDAIGQLVAENARLREAIETHLRGHDLDDPDTMEEMRALVTALEET